jgi:hypothetical protein
MFRCKLINGKGKHKYFEEKFLTLGEANVFAKTYLNLMRKKSWTIIVEKTNEF